MCVCVYVHVCIYWRPLGVGERVKNLESREVNSSPNSLCFLVWDLGQVSEPFRAPVPHCSPSDGQGMARKPSNVDERVFWMPSGSTQVSWSCVGLSVYHLFVPQTPRTSETVWMRQETTQARVLSLELGVRQRGQMVNRCSDNYPLALGV